MFGIFAGCYNSHLVCFHQCWETSFIISSFKHVLVREKGVALSHGVPPPRSFTCANFFFFAVFDSRCSFFAPKPHGRASYAGYGGPREQCPSVPRGGVKEEKREKKKRSVADRERGVSLSLYSV